METGDKYLDKDLGDGDDDDGEEDNIQKNEIREGCWIRWEPPSVVEEPAFRVEWGIRKLLIWEWVGKIR